MARGGRVTGKRSCRKRVRSKEPPSDDSDEDYVVSDAGGDVSDCLENDWFSLDGCASEDSLDDFVEEEEDEEVQRVRKFNRSRAKNGVRHQRKNASKTSRKRSRITYDEQLEREDEEEEEEEEEELEQDEDEDEGDEEEEEEESDEDDDKDEDFSCEDDEEFTPEEEDYSDEEEETIGRKKKSNGIKTGKKALRKRDSVTSSRGRKRKRSRASKKPLRKRKRKNGRSRRKVQRGDVDGLIDNGSSIRISSKKNSRRVRRRLIVEDSDSDGVSKSSDHEFTISEEERQQVREAEELCGSLKRNQRSASLQIQMKNEEVLVHDDLHQQRKPQGRKGKEKIDESKGRKGKEKVEDLKSEVAKQVCGICLSEENKRRIRGVLNCCTHYFCFACIMEWSKVESRCPLCKQRFNTISKSARPTIPIDMRELVIQVPECNQVFESYF